ncbi:tryptophan synthase subunit alpha [Oscillochloris sp. ZM17-4]|uniref:tryptophan synthase subunit alpha n=1 Tax=Oscillochloris sp. ZM17-4 TaxID=2866714 RepID=UPI001C737592|nr:tryptophan synthase subunit alpha [Oscillochloris sp. ZM17-4]MBX0327563.1 tryptophan synthase subunit alpha [Oscillochloris sp. ZM17-4]
MSRIAETFARLRGEGRVALMPYLTVGFPERESTLDLVPALEAAGASLFELGMPFSDPLADGATIQRATQRALENGVNLASCIETVAALRARGVAAPMLLMGYYNPLIRYGVERACADLAAAGGDGWIIPDMPPEESAELHAASAAHGLDLIMFVAPTTPDERIAAIAAQASGFIYIVSLTGVTGARASMSADLSGILDRVRRVSDLPLVVGFGISSAAHVADVARFADGAIVGSALIARLEGLPAADLVSGAVDFVADLLGGAAAPSGGV